MSKDLIIDEKNNTVQNEIQIFASEDFGQIRTKIIDGEPWLVLKDVCDVLELTTPSRVADRLEEDEVSSTHVIDSIGRKQETNIINEAGFYRVVMRSDSPKAKPFQRWVTREVLPSVRKHGAYMTQDVLNKAIGNPDFMIGLLTALKEEQEKVEQLNSEIEENRPATLTGKAVESSTNGILVGQYVPVLREAGWDIGSSRLFKEFREDNFLCSQKGLLWNKPSQFCLENDYMKYRTSVYTNSQGEQQTSYTPLITGKGQLYFLNYYKNKYGF